MPTARTHTIADELGILHDRLPLVAAERPEWADRIERLLTGCDGLAAAIPEPLVTGIHRDYYPDQVLVAGAACTSWTLTCLAGATRRSMPETALPT